jgi:hypothetical protein
MQQIQQVAGGNAPPRVPQLGRERAAYTVFAGVVQMILQALLGMEFPTIPPPMPGGAGRRGGGGRSFQRRTCKSVAIT